MPPAHSACFNCVTRQQPQQEQHQQHAMAAAGVTLSAPSSSHTYTALRDSHSYGQPARRHPAPKSCSGPHRLSHTHALPARMTETHTFFGSSPACIPRVYTLYPNVPVSTAVPHMRQHTRSLAPAPLSCLGWPSPCSGSRCRRLPCVWCSCEGGWWGCPQTGSPWWQPPQTPPPMCEAAGEQKSKQAVARGSRSSSTAAAEGAGVHAGAGAASPLHQQHTETQTTHTSFSGGISQLLSQSHAPLPRETPLVPPAAFGSAMFGSVLLR